MKRFFLFLGLFITLVNLASAQIDIQVGGIGPVRDVVRNVTWANSGIGAFNNSYIFTPAFPNETACLYVSNNDSSSHALSLIWYVTGDQNVNTYQGNTGKWVPAANNVFQPSIAASVTKGFFASLQNASRVAIVASNGSSTGTVTLTLVESQLSVGCGNNVTNGQVVCPIMATVSIATGTTQQIATAQPGNQIATYICGGYVSTNTAFAATGSIQFTYGTGTTCGTGTGNLYTIATGTGTPMYLLFPQLPGGFLTRYLNGAPDLATQNICLTNSTGQTLQIGYTFVAF
jgi:hypothetical protein